MLSSKLSEVKCWFIKVVNRIVDVVRYFRLFLEVFLDSDSLEISHSLTFKQEESSPHDCVKGHPNCAEHSSASRVLLLWVPRWATFSSIVPLARYDSCHIVVVIEHLSIDVGCHCLISWVAVDWHSRVVVHRIASGATDVSFGLIASVAFLPARVTSTTTAAALRVWIKARPSVIVPAAGNTWIGPTTLAKEIHPPASRVRAGALLPIACSWDLSSGILICTFLPWCCYRLIHIVPCFDLFGNCFCFSPVDRHLVFHRVFGYVPMFLWDAVDVRDLTVAEASKHQEDLCPQV